MNWHQNDDHDNVHALENREYDHDDDVKKIWKDN